MPSARHATDAILDATRDIVLRRGVQNASINAIAKASGAPVGSLYHRFGSRDDLVAELWIRAARRSQAAFLTAVGRSDPTRAAVDAALSLHDFAREHRDDARLLVSFRRDDLLHATASRKFVRTLDELNRPVEQAVIDLTRRLFGRATREAVEQTMLAVLDVPLGAMRRHLVAGADFPAGMRAQIEAAVRAILATRGRP